MIKKKYPSLQITANIRAVISFVLLYFLFLSSPVMAATSALWGNEGELWDPRGRLPDYSYAGYQRSEVPLPTVSLAGAFDVTQPPFYADPADNGNDDTAAIQNAIDEAEAVGGGVIYLPPGHYQVERYIRVRSSNIVIKGAGINQTKIYFPFSATEAYPPHEPGYVSGGSGNFINFEPYFYSGTENAYRLLQGAKKGDQTLVLDNDALQLSNLQPDDFLLLGMKDEYLYGPMFAHFHNGQQGPNPDPPCSYGGPDGNYPVKVKRVEGNLVTFYKPFSFDIRYEWLYSGFHYAGGKPMILKPNLLHECGIEDIHFEFRQVPKKPHLNEDGFNAIKFSACVDSWIRNVRVDHSDNAIFINDSSHYITVENIELGGRDGHHGITAGGQATSVLMDNILVENQWNHAITISGAVGCVLSRMTALNEPAAMDLHRGQPIETLWTEVTNWSYNSSGNGCQGPISGARTTYWNLSGTMGEPSQNGGAINWGSIQCNVVGDTSMPDLLTDDREWYEDMGSSITPVNLFDSQLNRRLNSSPKPIIDGSYKALGDRKTWFERDPSRWEVTDNGIYKLNFSDYESSNSGGNTVLGEFSIFDPYTLSGNAGIESRISSAENFNDNPDADYAMILGYQDPRNYYFASLAESGLRIVRVVNGNGSVRGSDSSFDLLEGWHTSRFSREGSKLVLRYDGQVRMSVTDTTFMSGKAGIGSIDDMANFKVLRFIGSDVDSVPVWNSSPVVRSDATQGNDYIAENQMITERFYGDFYDLASSNVSVSNISQDAPAGGTNWLTITETSSGSGVWQLSGTPSAADVGLNRFTLRASDGSNSADIELQITVEGQSDPILVWMNDNGIVDLEADDDNDGISNLAEYALGGVPSNGNDAVSLNPIVVQQSGNSINFRFDKNVGDPDAGLTYYVETTSDLSGTWTIVPGGEFLPSNTSTGIQTVNIPFSDKIFVRLRIER